MEIRAATITDWPLLQSFYMSVYKAGHPLQNRQFWQWQFGNPRFGQAFIAIDNGHIAGHLGVALSDGFAWHINLYVLQQYRHSNIALSLISEADNLGAPGNINANADAVKLYRLLGWYHYTNLVRMTLVNPGIDAVNLDSLLESISVEGEFKTPAGHYWEQPGLQGVLMDDGSQAVLQPSVGAIRFATLANSKKAVEQAWQLGFKWADYITSFNNPLLARLERQGWQTDIQSNIPWLLNPVVKKRISNISFLTKDPITIDFYVNRTHSDIGRVGSLPI
ncbi:MAG TPA: GNAT family N-acetyltransferase [Chitinophagaceae bacterium]|nr:GNAT family N-acetyltransferase [Chitinophagaceae bacterium]